MSLRDIGKRFQEKFLGSKEEKTPEEVVKKEVIEPIQDENIDLTSQQIATQIIELLNQYPADKRKVIIEELRKSDAVSSAMLVGAAVKAVDSKEIPDALAVELGRQASDKTAVGILENAEMSRDNRLKIIETLADNKLKEEAICKELAGISHTLKDLEVQNELASKINHVIGITKRTDKINEQLYKLIAKNFAITYHKTNGGLSLYQMEQVVPIHEMIRENMPEKIEEEYIKLLKDGEENKFDIQEVKERFVDQMAKEVHEKAQKEGQPESTFMKFLGEVSKEKVEIEEEDKENLGCTVKREIGLLEKYIRKYNEQISQSDLERCLKIARGEEEEFVYKPKKESKKELLEENAEKEINIEVLEQCIDSGLIDLLEKMDEKEREESLRVIINSLEKRLQKGNHVAKDGEVNSKYAETLKNIKITPKEEIPKVKRAEWGDDAR